ncbi:hypothetical protein FFWV33_08695 [Flavobacterium faecale]|uniref:Uncharacterized protein n=1 Tax=Flavobacterium faecale TaxID=1355330 RepID=A0A2S1LCW9_9FLAO|nr:hypothetical protein [Flavobacterium faecale]AWG21605.1 hypothetical protein FFWV33_08695 [Flavobacterium faecale]
MAAYKDQNLALDNSIAQLLVEREIKLNALKRQLNMTFESVKPVNILKDTLADFNKAPEAKADIFQSILSISGGYLTKKLVMGKSNSIFKKALGYVVQYGLTKFISNKVSTH